METIHRDKNGNILSYENWKGEITSAEDMLSYILNIQTEQLAKCHKLYNVTCYNALALKVVEENAKITLKTNAYDIFRGQQMSEFVHNYSNSTQINPLQDGIDAMTKLAEFNYNYDNGFIQKAFDGRMIDHLQSKFDGFYQQWGPRGVMAAFISELDSENKKALFSYILSK